MKTTTDIIRSILDIIDSLESIPQTSPSVNNEPGEQGSRFKHILSMVADKKTGYDNSPNEVVAPVDSVTTDAGGGMNGPKHVADIRVKDPRGY
jgi:hypothetical protein